jgi:hypothetical protein
MQIIFQHKVLVQLYIYNIVTCIMWLKTGFGLVNRFIWYSLAVTTINYNTLQITVIIAHIKSSIHMLSPQKSTSNSSSTQLWFNPESESYVTTNSQSASLSWNKAPIWGLQPNFYYCQTVVGLLMWGTLSDERTGQVVYNCCWRSPVPYISVSDPRLPFLSPPMTRRATVEVFDPASTWTDLIQSQRIRVTLRLAVYHQSVCLRAKLL